MLEEIRRALIKEREALREQTQAKSAQINAIERNLGLKGK